MVASYETQLESKKSLTEAEHVLVDNYRRQLAHSNGASMFDRSRGVFLSREHGDSSKAPSAAA